MSSRNNDFLTGNYARLSLANFNQAPRRNPMRHESFQSFRDSLSPQSTSSESSATVPKSIAPPVPYAKTTTRAYGTKPAQLPLSVYELPTATFMWARWDPRGDSESESRIYVRYRSQTSDTDSNSTYSTSTYSRPHSPVSCTMGSSQSSPASTPPPLSYSRKRSSSAESDHEGSAPASPSDRLLKLPRVASDYGAPPNVPPTSASYSAGCANKEATKVYRPTSGAESDSSDVELRPATFFYPAHQSNSSRDGGAVVPRSIAPATAVVPAPPVQSQEKEEEEEEEEPEDMKNAWIKYTYPSPELFAGPEFQCVWPLQKHRDGTLEPCGYHSKKHLVKRHIESKHLQLRPCKCQYCGKGFSQKSNLDTHLNTHTGDAPHKCHYCDEHFKDPARRHRHMILVHGHHSSRTKKGRMCPGRTASSAKGSEHGIEDVATPPPA
ncbi:transcription factor [Ganoderma sinense ZZ0214-1]|uniref:Transcription factor n=1 Tax=Ganoderma sinense ZZ0214-1 TaxID=1077348 RepID=A0A2G8STD9_9APHY|nr:transcription factor [Ganoderma sinense ZZ0214-1]